MCPDRDQYVHDNTTMWTDRKHIILVNHYVLSPKLERFKESVFLYFSASFHASASQLKEIENSHLLKNSNCKPIEHTHISTQSQPRPPNVYKTTKFKQSSIYDFNKAT